MHRFIVAAIAVYSVGAITGCATGPKVIGTPPSQEFLDKMKQAEASLNKPLWVSMQYLVKLCPKPSLGFECKQLDMNTRLTADGVVQGRFEDKNFVSLSSQIFYHVNLNDGRTGYVDEAEVRHGTVDIDPAITEADCRRRGDPRVGMSAKQVEATCWGKPDHIDTKQSRRGTSERWTYSNTRFLLLHNGVVTAVQFREKS